ncbi:hypothetical protein K8F61_09610 [Microbacterium resistens]|uniref:Bacterial Ig domain-containing protein n=1 Tax=Microbacterium resistens TaxID=156977 RepID=A0ABY3RPX2_9MICO|nr:hypothetical protein [Microbacterium resistens]UGS24968.1 hypothetical protein K8F61_09610 [Microbacterium resistens]
MSVKLKRAIGGSLLTAVIAGGLTLTAVAPASAATVDTGVVKAAVQGDRLQGPFITRTTYRTTGTHNPAIGSSIWYWNNFNRTTETGQLRGEQRLGTPGVLTPPAFQQDVEIWTFPAPGTTGPLMNSSGECLMIQGPPANFSSRAYVGSCDSAVQITVLEDGRMALADYPGFYLADWSAQGGMGLGAFTNESVERADSLYLGGLTPVTPEPADCTAGLTGTIGNVDQAGKSAVVSGTGKAGETITVTGSPTGPVTVVVADDGTWSATVAGLATGDNTLTVSSSDNCAPVELSVLIDELEIPVAHPAAVAGAGVLGLGALLIAALRRRAASTN